MREERERRESEREREERVCERERARTRRERDKDRDRETNQVLGLRFCVYGVSMVCLWCLWCCGVLTMSAHLSMSVVSVVLWCLWCLSCCPLHLVLHHTPAVSLISPTASGTTLVLHHRHRSPGVKQEGDGLETRCAQTLTSGRWTRDTMRSNSV